MHGVAGLGVGALEVEEVAGLKADSGAAKSNAGGCERAEAASKSCGLAEISI
jgi:hypothetical protein